MAIGNYPTPEFGGSPWLKFRDLDPDWSVVTTEQEMEDGGADYNLEADESILRWEFEYVLIGEYIDIHDGHRESAKGITQSFTFVHPRTGVAYTGVRYESYERNHTKNHAQMRTVRLVRRP